MVSVLLLCALLGQKRRAEGPAPVIDAGDPLLPHAGALASGGHVSAGQGTESSKMQDGKDGGSCTLLPHTE